MATMIPDGVDEFKTEGERRFYRFLELAAKPDREFTTWYLPDIEGREPDFILFSEDIGLVIIEVKDWALEQIQEANPRNFTLRMGRDRRSLKNPMHQAREYYESLMHRMRADGRLLSRDAGHYGKPKVPVDYGVAFPNINREPYCRSRLKDVISPRRIFFLDDIRTDSEICADDSGECFKRALMEMFPPRFRFRLTPAEYGHLKQLLFPVVRIEQPGRDTCSYIDPTQRVRVLDDRQEAIARRPDPAVQVICGPSGSGKTLILAHKAAFLKHYAPETRIFFLCCNPALVNYIKRLLSDKGIGLGPGGVEVWHFYELCSKLLGREVDCGREDGEHLRKVAGDALERLRETGPCCEAVLVDEGQDFTDEMFAVIEALSDPGRPNITIALDESQNVHGRALGWRDRLEAGGARFDRLAASYRNTVETRRFAFAFARIPDSPHIEGESAYCETRGPKPELVRLEDAPAVCAHIADTAREFHLGREYPLSEMAVLYPVRISGQDPASFPRQIAAAVESRGLISNWFSEDAHTSRLYDITTDRIAVSTIQDAMGLDYACVFLAGLDLVERDPASEEMIRKLVYSGITRARHRLIIPYARRNWLIEELLAC